VPAPLSVPAALVVIAPVTVTVPVPVRVPPDWLSDDAVTLLAPKLSVPALSASAPTLLIVPVRFAVPDADIVVVPVTL
jgi:hypothetical protein